MNFQETTKELILSLKVGDAFFIRNKMGSVHGIRFYIFLDKQLININNSIFRLKVFSKKKNNIVDIYLGTPDVIVEICRPT